MTYNVFGGTLNPAQSNPIDFEEVINSFTFVKSRKQTF